jgi:predicted dehydrogenase
MSGSKEVSRRRFLGSTAVGAAVPYVVPGSVLGQAGKPAPSERIQVALIGCGGMGQGNLNNCARHPDVVVTASCDVNPQRRAAVAAKYKASCRPYADFRDVFARKDVDAVIIATPPHWHAVQGILACEAGKDLYVQKPMTLHLAESLALRNAVRKHNRISQVGTQIHASENYRRVVEFIQAGLLGPIGCVRGFSTIPRPQRLHGPSIGRRGSCRRSICKDEG